MGLCELYSHKGGKVKHILIFFLNTEMLLALTIITRQAVPAILLSAH